MARYEIETGDGIWIVSGATVTDASVQHAVVDLAQRLGSIQRAILVGHLRAVAEVVERNAPADGAVNARAER